MKKILLKLRVKKAKKVQMNLKVKKVLIMHLMVQKVLLKDLKKTRKCLNYVLLALVTLVLNTRKQNTISVKIG